MQKISIITINFNNATGLEQTISSVLNQTYQNIEYIIIDGGSTDDSLNIIKVYESRINYWISEKDDGVYDAMNKGIEKASGDYLFMLNSGDYLCQNTTIESIFNNKKKVSIIYGNLIWEKENVFINQQFPNPITFRFLKNSSIGHQAAFIHKSAHQLIGFYDLNYKITADWVFFILAIFKHQLSFEYVNQFISYCPRDGISCRLENYEQISKEREKLLKSEFGNLLPELEELYQKEISYHKLKNHKVFRAFTKLKTILNKIKI